MKIEIIKAPFKEVEYKAGDVITLGNPYDVVHYLLIERNDGNYYGAINLINNDLEHQYSKRHGFEYLVSQILKNNEWDEWAHVKSEDVTMILNCKNGAMEQRNNNGSF